MILKSKIRTGLFRIGSKFNSMNYHGFTFTVIIKIEEQGALENIGRWLRTADSIVNSHKARKKKQQIIKRALYYSLA